MGDFSIRWVIVAALILAFGVLFVLPKKKSQKIMPFVAAAATLWVIIYILGGHKWYEIDANELALVQGCYAVEGQPLFRIHGKTLISGEQSWGFEGSHEKSGDVLTMGQHLQFSRSEKRLVAASNISMVAIRYGPPLTLELWDERNQPVQAEQIACSR